MLGVESIRRSCKQFHTRPHPGASVIRTIAARLRDSSAPLRRLRGSGDKALRTSRRDNKSKWKHFDVKM
ncbi:hypothetical protein Q8A67_019105 [Cirrhinus molitorella]|uniref:Uncharacterized protein n=1 Tax=Cirrhinus molitorella TaxID=172907 RepID=A0AA88PDC3_9TELE|nr:hypothetical protein Q8A67_019105 [Cirrhinus molitorella]